jgi:hypothetical protein
VINLSLGGSIPLLGGSDPDVDAALDRALDRGIVVVAAAGNNGLPLCEQPSGEGRLLCVGAVDKRGNRALFSNFGSGLGIVAPGGSGLPGQEEDILSTYNDGGYEEIAGTSLATPFVAGVAALLVSEGIRGQFAVQRILATAHDAGPVGPDSEYGAGIVDAAGAVAGLGGAGGGSGSSGSQPSGAPPGSGASSAARVSVPHRIGRARLLRHGLPVRCVAAGDGRCSATARMRRTIVANGARRVTLGTPVVVHVGLTSSGRRIVAHRHRSLRLLLAISGPGITPKSIHVTVLGR